MHNPNELQSENVLWVDVNQVQLKVIIWLNGKILRCYTVPERLREKELLLKVSLKYLTDQMQVSVE